MPAGPQDLTFFHRRLSLGPESLSCFAVRVITLLRVVNPIALVHITSNLIDHPFTNFDSLLGFVQFMVDLNLLYFNLWSASLAYGRRVTQAPEFFVLSAINATIQLSIDFHL